MPFPLAQGTLATYSGVQVQGPSQPVQRCWGVGGWCWVPTPSCLWQSPLWLWCPSSRGQGQTTGGHISAPTPYPFFSSWEAPLVVSELNQQEEGRLGRSWPRGPLLLWARAPGVLPAAPVSTLPQARSFGLSSFSPLPLRPDLCPRPLSSAPVWGPAPGPRFESGQPCSLG